MAFEKWEPQPEFERFPASATIVQSRLIRLPSPVANMLRLRGKASANLYYDKKRKVIGIKPLDRKEEPERDDHEEEKRDLLPDRQRRAHRLGLVDRADDRAGHSREPRRWRRDRAAGRATALKPACRAAHFTHASSSPHRARTPAIDPAGHCHDRSAECDFG